ncbi:transcriptional regulator [Labrys miyagiensis]|uniref:Transcriptional regulator n=1 Tax=Labrys miyagiensis TaxID=346912 RepID=A0ABQ6CMV0_9HYPH|nr:SMC-Scp complex subunit ScpB [Labrys miyagiensis]GLS21692.1 transcriptional regulator [Labrys miyagiensis]
MAKPRSAPVLDRELADLPPAVRWRQWMGRVEAVIFASPQPVGREDLAKLVGEGANLDLLIDDIRAELVDRPYDLVAVAGRWQHRTRPAFAGAIRASELTAAPRPELTPLEATVLLAIGYFQPVTRGELSKMFGREVSRDLIANLRSDGFVGTGPRSPQPGAPYTYVTTPGFLEHFGFQTLRDLPDLEMLEDAGLLSKARLLAEDLQAVPGEGEGEDDAVEEAEDISVFGGAFDD